MPLRWTLSFLRPYRGRVIILALLSLAEIGLGALQPWPLKAAVDYAISNPPVLLPPALASVVAPLTHGSRLSLLILVVVVGLLISILNQIASMLHTQVQVDTGQRMVFDVRAQLFDHLQALGLKHFAQTNTGDAVYRLEADAYCVDNLVMSGVFPLASAVLTLVVMFSVLAKIDPTLALVSLAVIPVLFACLRYYLTRMVDRAERVKELESKLVERLYEIFAAIRLVKSFVRERHERQRMAESAGAAMEQRIRLTWQESLFSVLVSTTTLSGTALILFLGGKRVLDGQMTVGTLLVVIAYLGSVYGPLSAIAHTIGQLQQALASVRRIRKSLAEEPEVMEAPGSLPAQGLKGEVRFENVSFHYQEGQRVLHEVSFCAQPGQTVAIVGLTGAGKSTLVSLIPRFYDPTAGQLLIDGVEVRRYGLRSLRQSIAVVLQDSMLFAGTVRDNLRYGRLDATDEEVEAAARAAQAHEFVTRLPQGYDSLVAEWGGGFSGGERQRLSIARAMLKDAPILIMDEPTSSLDTLSEAAVFEALRGLRRGRTTFVIAHRLSTIQDADVILVLDGGRIVARGNHRQLLADSDLYRRMCARLSVGRSLDEPQTVDELVEAAR